MPQCTGSEFIGDQEWFCVRYHGHGGNHEYGHKYEYERRSYERGGREERTNIVAWLRASADKLDTMRWQSTRHMAESCRALAVGIERGDHDPKDHRATCEPGER